MSTQGTKIRVESKAYLKGEAACSAANPKAMGILMCELRERARDSAEKNFALHSGNIQLLCLLGLGRKINKGQHIWGKLSKQTLGIFETPY